MREVENRRLKSQKSHTALGSIEEMLVLRWSEGGIEDKRWGGRWEGVEREGGPKTAVG